MKKTKILVISGIVAVTAFTFGYVNNAESSVNQEFQVAQKAMV
ncbi:hypothetical protein [Bacillus atrophaeus]|nr:hypothetical protein [Bacillus atrophaeus]MED4806297.1 hypothetical protein [Bacillus atrophaeus]UFD97586.1 Quorum sensing peptide Phr [Bacillus atrophaeus]GED04287.1 hypothetical protein BAT02nite_39310 [Bacillus atrophaeus]